jgi:hypothetical protein
MTNNINQTGLDRPALEAAHGKVWNEEEFAREFHVGAIIGTVMVVVRRSDGQVGRVAYQNRPRFYYDFQPSKVKGDEE